MNHSIPFKVGDLVMLKSGGPIMTVNYVRDEADDECICVWFNDKKDVLTKGFNQASLVKAENN